MNCGALLVLLANGWGLTVRCTLNEGHTGRHIGTVNQHPQLERHVTAEGVEVLEWESLGG